MKDVVFKLSNQYNAKDNAFELGSVELILGNELNYKVLSGSIKHRFLFYLAKDLSPRVRLEIYNSLIGVWIRKTSKLLSFKKTLSFRIDENRVSSRDVTRYTLDETKDGLYYVMRTDENCNSSYDVVDYLDEGYLLNSFEWKMLKRNINRTRKQLLHGFEPGKVYNHKMAEPSKQQGPNDAE